MYNRGQWSAEHDNGDDGANCADDVGRRRRTIEMKRVAVQYGY